MYSNINNCCKHNDSHNKNSMMIMGVITVVFHFQVRVKHFKLLYIM